MHCLHDTQSVCGTIPEIRIAKRDVLSTFLYLCTDISQHNVGWDSKEASLIDWRDRTVQAGMLTTAC